MSANTEENIQPNNIRSFLDERLIPLLDERDGVAKLCVELPGVYPLESIIHEPGQSKPKNLRIWECVALYFRGASRFYDALSILNNLYDSLLLAQEKVGKRSHKGMPLIWISDIYRYLGFQTLAKRYLMLTLVEDAITTRGEIPPSTSGTYFRLVWLHGLPDQQLHHYEAEAFSLSQNFPVESLYPEWILQDLDQEWVTEYPSLQERAIYSIHTSYAKYLISRLGDGSGAILERFAEYILASMPGCRAKRRQITYSTDYDVICSMEGVDIDFRSELGRYFVCECKDWDKPADITVMAKFCRLLDSIKAHFGILFSQQGITGAGNARDAEREQLKVFQDRGIVIVVVDQNDLEKVANGANFINLLRRKYETVRLDLRHGH